jgi:hypothetical protein
MSKDFVVGTRNDGGYAPEMSRRSYTEVMGYAGVSSGSYVQTYAPAPAPIRKAYGIRPGVALAK